jgi:hypothetical protein
MNMAGVSNKNALEQNGGVAATDPTLAFRELARSWQS